MALSLKKIAAERANVKLRTERRIAQLYADAGITTGTLELRNWHSCLNTSCFCLLLLCINLLFCQWLYLSSTVTVIKVLSILYGFGIGENFFLGAIGNIFGVQTLLHCTNKQDISSKNFHIFFSYAFLGVRHAEFWLVQSN